LIDKGLNQVFAFRDDSPFIQGSFAYNTVGQVSRIKLDEQGVKAASATFGCGMAKSDAPLEPKTMHLDRPFIYVITTSDNIILFSGIINRL
jgi:serine protease inhibitor